MILLITGLTGIAAATAGLAEQRGHTVYAVGLPETDLTHAEAAEKAAADCVSRHGRIDALFQVAGSSGRRWGDGPLHQCSDDGWRKTLAANLDTTFHISRAVLNVMLHQPPDAQGLRGSILLMSSVLALEPEPTHFATHAYTAAKGAILAMARSMAASYAPQKIRVNAIAPGLVDTPMSERARTDASIDAFVRIKQPLADGSLPAAEVAEAALFLLSPESRHITGQTLILDGGWSLT